MEIGNQLVALMHDKMHTNITHNSNALTKARILQYILGLEELTLLSFKLTSKEGNNFASSFTLEHAKLDISTAALPM